METKARSVAKAISWRILASITTGLLVFALTGEAKIATGIGFLDLVVKIILYYLHERIWLLVPAGRHPIAKVKVKKQLTEKDLKIIEEKLRELGYIED